MIMLMKGTRIKPFQDSIQHPPTRLQNLSTESLCDAASNIDLYARILTVSAEINVLQGYGLGGDKVLEKTLAMIEA